MSLHFHFAKVQYTILKLNVHAYRIVHAYCHTILLHFQNAYIGLLFFIYLN